MRHIITKPDSTINRIVNASFSGYKGKRIILSTEIPTKLDSYWDGGSKDSYAFYNLDTGKSKPLASNHPFFEKQNPRDLLYLPERNLLVKHSIFCGKDMGITIYANEKDLTPMIPESIETVSKLEYIVLKYTWSLKNSYGGEKNIRMKSAIEREGITKEDWIETQEKLAKKNLLRSHNKSITPEGENAIINYENHHKTINPS